MAGAASRPGSNPGAVVPSAPRPGSIPGVTRPLASPARERHAEGRPPAPLAPRSRPLLALFPLGTRVADAYLAMAGLAYLEVYTVGLLSLRQFVGPFELGIASRGLMPIALVAAAPSALVAGALVELLRRAAGPRARVGAAAAASVFAGAVGYGVAGGRFFEGGRRVPFAVVVAALAAFAAFALAPRLARLLEPPRGGRRAGLFFAALAASIALVELVNARVLPRLYPAFHLGLGAIALLLAAAAGLAFGALDAAPRRGSVTMGGLRRGSPAAVPAGPLPQTPSTEHARDEAAGGLVPPLPPHFTMI